VVAVPLLRRACIVPVILVSMALMVARPADAHPLHTSFATIEHDKTTGTLVISMRVFLDDFTKASTEYRSRLVSGSRTTSSQSPLISYALANFRIADESGKALTLESCGGNRVGDLLLLCFKIRMTEPPRALRVSNTILFDHFKDQINVVQASLVGRKANALFSPGDGSKLLR